MIFKSIKNDPFKIKADALIIGTFFQPLFVNQQIKNLDKLLDGALSEEVCVSNFLGKIGEILIVDTHGALPEKRVILLGLGELKSYNGEVIRSAAGTLFRFLKNKRLNTLAVSFYNLTNKLFLAYDAAKAFTEGATLASYDFDKYKKEKEKQKENAEKVKEIFLIAKDAVTLKQIEKGIREAKISCGATFYARDLVNEPASVCVPAHLVAHGRAIVKAGKGKIRVKIFNKEECRKRGMDAFLSVASGAGEEPYFIHLIYKGQNAKKKIALVGKGITFDSGGLQTKPGDSMATMKLDMAGAAAVLGVFSKIVEISPRAEVHGIIAATENMPGSHAYKPGDIVRASNGKTVEIGHTDAEGRVTLADSLSYAAKLKPDAMIDLATLTGACMVALGEEVAGVMGNNVKLVQKIKESAETSGEKLWELPLISEYRPLIKGTHADVRNSGASRYGGAITAGLFLEEFVGKTPWAHLDIAGPAYAERETISYIPLGGTGYGVRTLIDFLKKI